MSAKKTYGPTGYCPNCGTSLRKSVFIEVWDPKGKPSETSKNWECPVCKVRWEAVIVNERTRLKRA